jgi:hypothetical protein
MNHAKLLFYSKDVECDMCDKHKECAILESLGHDCLVICLNCLKKIVKHKVEL